MRNVYALGLVSFFTDVSSEMVFSLLPVFILGLPGYSRALLGFIEGTAEALSYRLSAVSGYFSDRFRKGRWSSSPATPCPTWSNHCSPQSTQP